MARCFASDAAVAFAFGRIRNPDVIADAGSSTEFGHSGHCALMLHDVGAALNGGHAFFYGNREMVGTELRFSQFGL